MPANVPLVTAPPGDKRGVRALRRAGGPDAIARFIEPGRSAFEFSLALSALSLAFPWLVVGAVAAAARAWRRGSSRGGRAAAAAVWCCLLGVAIRVWLGFGVFP